MHLPPPAQVSVGRNRVFLVVLVVWTAVYAGLFGALSGSMEPMALAVLALTSAGAWGHAAWHWWNSPIGTLAWTGREWIWQQAQDKQKCRVRWGADFQSVVLLELQMTGRPGKWLWVDRGVMGAGAWRSFRRALVGAANAPVEAAEDETVFAVGYLSSARKPHI